MQAAERVWAEQERLRSTVVAGSKGLKGTPDRLARICKLLTTGCSEQDCLDVLHAVAEQVTRDPSKAQWFNGETNWRPANFDRELGRIGAGVATAQAAVGRANPLPSSAYQVGDPEF